MADNTSQAQAFALNLEAAWKTFSTVLQVILIYQLTSDGKWDNTHLTEGKQD